MVWARCKYMSWRAWISSWLLKPFRGKIYDVEDWRWRVSAILSLWRRSYDAIGTIEAIRVTRRTRDYIRRVRAERAHDDTMRAVDREITSILILRLFIERVAAKEAGDYARADMIRKKLGKLNHRVMDYPGHQYIIRPNVCFQNPPACSYLLTKISHGKAFVVDTDDGVRVIKTNYCYPKPPTGLYSLIKIRETTWLNAYAANAI